MNDLQIGTSRTSNGIIGLPSSTEIEGGLSPTMISAINNLSIDENSSSEEEEEEEEEDVIEESVDDDDVMMDDGSQMYRRNSRNYNRYSRASTFNNDNYDESTINLSQPVAPEEPLRAIVINRPTAQMIETYRLPKPKDQMSEQEINNLIMSPVPQGQKVLCKITRKRDKFGKFYPLYELFIEERDNNGEQIRTFLMSARKKKKSKSSHYIITTEKLTSSSTPKNIVGRVRSNFLGTAFVIYSHGKNPFKHEPDSTDLPLREELGSVVYDPNILGFKGPRKMTILLIGMMISGERPEFRPKEESETLIGKFRNGDKRDILVLHNKSPQWNEDTRSYVLNFSGRVTLASVKNFQIVHDNDLDYIIMQFGRVSEDSFTMDFMYPMCPIQAFAIALTSFDAKLACE